MSEPSTNGVNGRDAGGRFAAGNPGGPGNPHNAHVARLRAVLLDAVDEADIRAIVHALMARAKSGDVVAAREVLDRLLGKSVQPVQRDEPTHSFPSVAERLAKLAALRAKLGAAEQ